MDRFALERVGADQMGIFTVGNGELGSFKPCCRHRGDIKNWGETWRDNAIDTHETRFPNRWIARPSSPSLVLTLFPVVWNHGGSTSLRARLGVDMSWDRSRRANGSPFRRYGS